MRKILFRGKRCDNGEWVHGSYIEAKDGWHNRGVHKEWICSHARSNGGWFSLGEKHAVISETVGQFTGLTDKNGKEIFEGDIVRDEMECIGVVEYSDGAYTIEYEKPIMPEWNGILLYVEEPKELIVIGSVHDGPVESEGSN